jgi:hypothetical protein
MSLAALLCQPLLKSLSHEPTKLSVVKQIVFVPATLVLTMLLVSGFVGWSISLGAVSGSSRNMALLYGVISAHGSLVYLLTRKQEAIRSSILQSYITIMFWPPFLGLMLGTFIAVVPDMAPSNA